MKRMTRQDDARGAVRAHRAAWRCEEHLIADLEWAAGEDDEPREQVLQDLAARQTHRQAAHAADRQHRVDCARTHIPGVSEPELLARMGNAPRKQASQNSAPHH